jgi:hypothetical protein
LLRKNIERLIEMLSGLGGLDLTLTAKWRSAGREAPALKSRRTQSRHGQP